MSSEPALDLQGLHCDVAGKALLSDVSLRLAQGAIGVLYGANGAGKSTLLKLIAGLQEGSAGMTLRGHGRVLGHPLLGRRGAQRARLGYMPQQGGLYDELSVAENLLFRAAVLDVAAPVAAVRALLHSHGLQTVAEQRVSLLSGGWRQRVSFACAVLARPVLLLLDEPTAGVDLDAKSELWARIKAGCSNGVSALLSTHDTDEAASADLLIALARGRVYYLGPPAQLTAALGLRAARLRADSPGTQRALATLRDWPALQSCDASADGKAWHLVWRDTSDGNATLALGDTAGQLCDEPVTLAQGLRAVLREGQSVGPSR